MSKHLIVGNTTFWNWLREWWLAEASTCLSKGYKHLKVTETDKDRLKLATVLQFFNNKEVSVGVHYLESAIENYFCT